eukprot:10314662-Karenia_brevis.AAC.1
MKPDVLMKLMKSGRLSLRPTPESQLLKLRKQKMRVSRKTLNTTENPAYLAQRFVLDLDFKTNANLTCYFYSTVQ